MDRCAIFVDAGYLIAEGGKLVCGVPSRDRFKVDASGLNLMLRETATTRCGLPVLRTYWYDGAKDGIPTATHLAIAELPNVKLRLGRINIRNQQKGVDALIYRDLMTLARERAICEAFLLSGDEDLREGVRAAQDQGVRVTIVGVRPTDAVRNQSRQLLHEADEILTLTRDDIQTFFEETAAPAAQEPESADDVLQIGRRFAEGWQAQASDDEVNALTAGRPRIPQYLDVELLREAEAQLGISLRGNQPAKHQLRYGFWEAFPGKRQHSDTDFGVAASPNASDTT